MSLRGRFILGIVLVLFGTFGLVTVGVGYLVLRQNDDNGREAVRLGARLTRNQLTTLQDDILEQTRHFVSAPEHLVNLKYLDAKKGEGRSAYYTFALDRPKEEMAEHLEEIALASNVERFRLYDRAGELLALVDNQAGQIRLGIRSNDASGAVVFKYQSLVSGAEITSPWLTGAAPPPALPIVATESAREWWYAANGDGISLFGSLAINRPQDDPWGGDPAPLGWLVFEKRLDAAFLQQISAEIGMLVELEPVAAPLVNGGLDLPVEIVRVNADDFYRVAIPLPGREGRAGNLVVSLSRHTTLEKARENITLLLLLLGICLAAALPGAWLLAAGQARRFERILGAVERMAGGDLATRAAVEGGDELAKLATAVNNMAGDLQGLVDKLQQNEGLLRATLESTNEGVLVVESGGKISHFNQRFAELWHIPEAELGHGDDRALIDYVLPQIDDPAAFVKRIEAIYQTDEVFEEILTLSEGRVLERYTAPVRRVGGQNSRVWFFTDISERVRAAAQIKGSLAEAEAAGARLRAIVHSVPLGLIVTDMSGAVLLLNRAAELLFGREQEYATRHPARELIRAAEFDRLLDAALGGEAAQRPLDLELFDHARREVRTIQVGTSLVSNRDGLTTGVVVVLVDVTREREVARMKNEFISIAAHELHTPLTAVMGYVELLLDHHQGGTFSAEQQREFLTIVYDKSEALSRIVDELLLLSRMESGGKILLEPSPFVAQEMIRKVVELFAVGAQKERFVIDLPADDIEVVADRGKVIQVLENLVSNALKYSPDERPVRVFCCSNDAQWCFGVEDNGIGMTAEQVERIFEKFYRADTSSTAVGGLGLGMSIVKNIIDAHGGTIGIDSVVGRGTRVAVQLPSLPPLP